MLDEIQVEAVVVQDHLEGAQDRQKEKQQREILNEAETHKKQNKDRNGQKHRVFHAQPGDNLGARIGKQDETHGIQKEKKQDGRNRIIQLV